MPEKLKEIIDKILAWWNKFTSKQKTLIISAAAAVFFTFVIECPLNCAVHTSAASHPYINNIPGQHCSGIVSIGPQMHGFNSVDFCTPSTYAL